METAISDLMERQRDRLLSLARRHLREKAGISGDETRGDGLPEVFEEIVRAMRREAGGAAPAPARHENVAAEVGRAHQRDNADISSVVLALGAISDALGDLGAEHGLCFDPREYQTFTRCIDASTAAAIEAYAANERATRRREESKRLGFLAHELRNALATASMAYQALGRRRMTVDSQTGALLGRSLAAMEDLITRALAAVQLDVGAAIARRPVRLAILCRQIEAAALPDRGVHVAVDVDADLVVDGDERLLVSAVGNLVQNALKFTRQGGRVTVRGRRSAETAIVEVEDECGGLPDGQEQTLVRPFVQRDELRRGLGLGLSIAREAIEAQGGRMAIRNLPGKGCIFSLEIPAHEAAARSSQ